MSTDPVQQTKVKTELTTSCPLCHSQEYTLLEKGIRDFEYGTKGNYNWLRCLSCNLVRIDPLPSEELLKLAYPPDYHAFVEPKSILTKKLLSLSTKYLAKQVASTLPSKSSVIEIGCSTGLLLETIGKYGDYKLFGVEYKQEVVKEARSRGITVWEGAFEDTDIPPNSMDLAIMQYVIEHVFNPVLVMNKVNRLLKLGGKVIGRLPNIASWDAFIFKKYWGGGHAPRHIWHFTPFTLKHLLENCGFSEIKISPVLHTGHWALSIQNFLRRRKIDSKDLTSGRAWYYPLLLIGTIPINMIQMPILKTGIMKFEARKI